jgi:hypothetical protein
VALGGRVPAELATQIRRGVGYVELGRYWDWPRGILAALTVIRGQAAQSVPRGRSRSREAVFCPSREGSGD